MIAQQEEDICYRGKRVVNLVRNDSCNPAHRCQLFRFAQCFFGELSVLDRMPRNAMVAAEEPTSCLALASWDFDAVLLEQPALTLAILRGVAARLREVTESARH